MSSFIGIKIIRDKFIPDETGVISEEISTNEPGPSTSNDNVNPVSRKPNKELESSTKRKKQEVMDNFVVIAKPVPINKSILLDQQLIRMVVKEYQPFSIVEDIEFKKFVNMLCPGYSLPSRKTVTNSLLPQIYNKTKEEVKLKINQSHAVCITTDSWTSINNENFVAITAHWCDDTNGQLKLCSNLLDCVVYDKRHTAVNLCEFLQKKLEDWEIENKISVVVSDNAHNIVAAIRQGNWRHLGCFAHTINLIVQRGLREIEPTLNKFRRIVEFFKRSSHALSKLNQTQEQMQQQVLKLKIDVCTRWNSTLDMLDRLCRRREAIISTLAILQHEIILSPTDWDIANHAISILQIFNDVTCDISAEKNVSISKVILFVSAMENHLLEFKATLPLRELQVMLEIYLKEITERFKNLENNELVAQATLLDPRFKKYGFTNINKANNAVELLKSKIKLFRDESVNVNKSEEINKSVQLEESEDSRQKSSMLWKSFDEKVNKIRVPSNPTAAAILEIDKYMAEPLIDRHEDPLLWWYQRKNIYPKLYALVQRRLCITATSVPCERIFSKTGQIVSERRNRLKSSKISEIIFLHVNL